MDLAIDVECGWLQRLRGSEGFTILLQWLKMKKILPWMLNSPGYSFPYTYRQESRLEF